MGRTKPEPISEHELDRLYREMLDEVHGTVTIAGYEYETSRTLFEVDPTAYRCGFADWLDSEIQDGALTEVNGEYFESVEYEEYLESLSEEQDQ